MKPNLRVSDRRPLAAGALILWVALSPWLWGFADSHAAVADHVSLVLGFGPLALLIVVLRPAALVTIIGGVWLSLSPWVLGYATDHFAWVNELITGLMLVALSANAAGFRRPRRAGRRRERRRVTPGGGVAIESTDPTSGQ
jgi:hypothetical protein